MYSIMGFPNSSVINGLRFLLIYFLHGLTFAAMIEFMGSSFTSMDTALLVAGNLVIIPMTFSGVTVNYPNIPYYLRFLYWGNHVTYATNALLTISFAGWGADPYSIGKTEGDIWLESLDVQITGFWENVYIICIFLIFFRICTYLSLRFLHRSR
tara:strand:- start:104 stop:565 length:462 start_codon:yes stop_codon:yes gene_type:complete